MRGEKVENTFVAALPQLPQMMDFVRNILTSWGEGTFFRLYVGVEEVLINIIQHAYPKEARGVVTIGLEKGTSSILLTIEDRGIPFNPLEVDRADRTPPLDQCSLGGWGIALYREVFSEIQYSRKKGRNILHISYAEKD